MLISVTWFFVAIVVSAIWYRVGVKEGWEAGLQDRKLWRANDQARYLAETEELDGLVVQFRQELDDATAALAAAHAERDEAKSDRDSRKSEMYQLNTLFAKRADEAFAANQKLGDEIDRLSADNARLTEANGRLIAHSAKLADAHYDIKTFASSIRSYAGFIDEALPGVDMTGGIGVDVDAIREHIRDEPDGDEDDDDMDDMDDMDDLDDHDDDDRDDGLPDFDDETCPDCGGYVEDCDCDLDDLDGDDDDDLDDDSDNGEDN